MLICLQLLKIYFNSNTEELTVNVDEMGSVEVPYSTVNDDGGQQHNSLILSPNVLKRKLGIDASLHSGRVDTLFHTGPLLSPFLSSYQLKVCFFKRFLFFHNGC